MILIKDIKEDDADYKKQILIHPYMPDKVKQFGLEKVSEMKSNNNDYHKQLLFVKTLVKFPWVSHEETNIFKQKLLEKEPILLFNEIEENFNKKVFGHKKAKEQFILQIARWLSNPNGKGYTIGLGGPPGVGKTTLGKILAEIYCSLGFLTTDNFKVVSCCDLIAGYVGQTAIKTMRVLTESKGGVLFIDEAYSLGGSEDDNGNSFSKECLDTINKFLSENT